jgi:hypothetical protein
MDLLLGTLVVCQALGALVGTMCAVWGQIAYVRALRDGVVDRAERAHLDAIAHGLWVGMSLLLASSLGLVFFAHASGAAVQPGVTASYWALMILAFTVIGLTWALSRRHISFPIGAAAILMAWWMMLFLAFGRLPTTTLGATLAAYVVGAGILYFLLQYIHVMAQDEAEADVKRSA